MSWSGAARPDRTKIPAGYPGAGPMLQSASSTSSRLAASLIARITMPTESASRCCARAWPAAWLPSRCQGRSHAVFRCPVRRHPRAVWPSPRRRDCPARAEPCTACQRAGHIRFSSSRVKRSGRLATLDLENRMRRRAGKLTMGWRALRARMTRAHMALFPQASARSGTNETRPRSPFGQAR